MSETITIVAADDHSMFLEGLQSLLNRSAELQLLGTGLSGDQLIQLIEQYSPDIALVDLSMPGASMDDIFKYVSAHRPATQLIALTMHLEANMARSLLALGLSGYVLKESAFDELTLAIKRVAEGDQFLSPAIVEALNELNSEDGQAITLTDREREVLVNASQGGSNKMIARQLDISERTVRFHISNSCIKLNANGRANAVAVALKQGYID
ncbi:LuxR C-terminal-related transcriptional regulator [Amphritea sp.]|uniref:LuxR C-terminal-related transcriptional regulator n=1 Tax=Amphritea sp. TaxID=1872502 RepID=UPI003D0FDC64